MTLISLTVLASVALLLSACDDAALRSWNKLFGDKGKTAPPKTRLDRAAATSPARSSEPALLPKAQMPLSNAAVPRPVASPPLAVNVSQATQSFEFAPAKDGATRLGSTCAFPGLQLPADTRLYVAGAYAGRTLDYQIDQSGHTATRIDVAVNSPSAPVVLMLGAYEPTVWSVGWSRGSKILAVLVSGYHRQAITGLNADVPVMISSDDNQGPCGYFYVGGENSPALSPIARRAFGRRIDMIYAATGGQVVIGDALTNRGGLVTAKDASTDAFHDRDATLAGEAGINEALRSGTLRAATSADFQNWNNALAVEQGRLSPAAEGRPPVTPQVLHHVYVANRAFEFPAGLYGANSVTVIVPRGVPRPTGNGGHSQVLDYNALTCVGLTCRH